MLGILTIISILTCLITRRTLTMKEIIFGMMAIQPVETIMATMKVMMNLADNIYVLDYGVLIADGTPDEIKTNLKVIKAYLGGGTAHAAT